MSQVTSLLVIGNQQATSSFATLALERILNLISQRLEAGTIPLTPHFHSSTRKASLGVLCHRVYCSLFLGDIGNKGNNFDSKT